MGALGVKVGRKTCAQTTWFAACHRLVSGLEDGDLVLERHGCELRFRFTTPNPCRLRPTPRRRALRGHR
jgi:hypothetical protein